MSIGPVLTLGFGSFSTVNFLPTLGYSSGTAPTPPPPPPPQIILQPAAPPAGGGMAVGRTQIHPQFTAKPKPYVYTRNTENQDRADILAIIRMLVKGGFL